MQSRVFWPTEEIESWMQKEWGRDLQQIHSPQFGSYATLQRGKGYECEYAEWCGWLADLFEKGAVQIKTIEAKASTARRTGGDAVAYRSLFF